MTEFKPCVYKWHYSPKGNALVLSCFNDDHYHCLYVSRKFASPFYHQDRQAMEQALINKHIETKSASYYKAISEGMEAQNEKSNSNHNN